MNGNDKSPEEADNRQFSSALPNILEGQLIRELISICKVVPIENHE